MSAHRVRTSWQILLVRKHQQQRILHFPVLDDARELRPCLVDAVAVVGVDDEDQALCTCSIALAWLVTCNGGHGRGLDGRVAVLSCARACSPTRNRPLAPQHTREVVSPQRADLVLAADVPDIELGVLVCDRLDVEADGGDGGHVLVELELVEDRCGLQSAIADR
jgi:hypothetical protein